VKPFAEPQIVVFEYRMRRDADLDAYERLSAAMYELAASDEKYGLVGIASYRGDSGTTVVVEWFKNKESMRRWVVEPAHREAQRRGRDEFFEWFRVWVGTVDRSYSFGHVPLALK
jgi:heme-degrading monooxygenase HmoA